MDIIKINLAEKLGEIKPMHGINNLPYSCKTPESVIPFLKDCGAPYCRLHDTQGAYGGSYYVDVPNIFPDFDADENDENNYDFYLTDEFIKTIQESGCETFYRLGVTIEWASKKYRIHPPKDNLKWAKICEKIIAHYNEGWADGFHYGIKYWEIWNEPENPPMWTGTKEEFFDLYCTASKYLKEKYPHLSIGGYGSCGFYAVTREGLSDFYKSFVPYFTDFLDVVKERNATLDFYSWHIYSESVKEALAHAKYARETLDKNGFKDTETFLNEWNFGDEGTSHVHKRDEIGAAFVASVMCAMQQEGNVDGLMYYCTNSGTAYNGLVNNLDGSYFKPMYSMMMFNDIYKTKTWVKSSCESEGIYTLAAFESGKGSIMICNYTDVEKLIEAEISGKEAGEEAKCEFYLLDKNCDRTLQKTEIFRGDVVKPVIRLPKYSVTEIKISTSKIS